MSEPFGYLLTLDLYGCKEGYCDDLSYCYAFLDKLVAKLKMSKQSPPFLFKSDGTLFPLKAGLSGWVPIIESGIQIHTLTRKNFISIDVYSCKKFPLEGITEFVKDYFECKEVEVNFIERGVKYNHIQ